MKRRRIISVRVRAEREGKRGVEVWMGSIPAKRHRTEEGWVTGLGTYRTVLPNKVLMIRDKGRVNKEGVLKRRRGSLPNTISPGGVSGDQSQTKGMDHWER